MNLWKREEAATLTEYGLLLGLIAVIAIASLSLLGKAVSTMFSTIAGTI